MHERPGGKAIVRHDIRQICPGPGKERKNASATSSLWITSQDVERGPTRMTRRPSVTSRDQGGAGTGPGGSWIRIRCEVPSSVRPVEAPKNAVAQTDSFLGYRSPGEVPSKARTCVVRLRGVSGDGKFREFIEQRLAQARVLGSVAAALSRQRRNAGEVVGRTFDK